jgi:pepF/M3 family oligoendopeptidase
VSAAESAAESIAGSPPAEALSRWDLDPIYPGFGSEEYRRSKEELAALAEAFLAHIAAAPEGGLGEWLRRALELEDRSGSLHETLASYAYATYSVATRESAALAEINAVEALGLPLKRAAVKFRNLLAARRGEVEALLAADRALEPFAFHIREELFWQSRQMSPEMEDLAADLSRSGGEAWGRLQEAVSSNASALWDAASGARKTVVELRNLAYYPERSVREKAWRLELGAWKEAEIPLAAALNGVKGFAVTLGSRRGWESELDKSLRQARMTRASLDALLGAMEDSLPFWRRYLKAKARLLGLPACAFYDLFAPVGGASSGSVAGGAVAAGAGSESGGAGRRYSFEEAQDFVVTKFSAFDPDMGYFAQRAFDSRWIDALPREGKVGGAYCIDFPAAKAARVMCNFDGSFSGLSTMAHELGHAWHAEVMRGLPYVATQYPMTLAETASIFAETIVFEDAVARAPSAERLALIELHLQDACQVVVDILSRYRFESALFERRAKGELPPEELCSLMLDAQKSTYGEGLDPERLHPYMWAAKGHYYSPGLSFYNFPYAFGLLFGGGLYARYASEGQAFAGTYRNILRRTGSASAVAVTAEAGFDIESRAFWDGGLALFERQVGEFERLAAERVAATAAGAGR